MTVYKLSSRPASHSFSEASRPNASDPFDLTQGHPEQSRRGEGVEGPLGSDALARDDTNGAD